MEKPKRWHKWAIISCITLTLYNILPTLFFYTKPLSKPIDAPRAEKIATQIATRINGLEEETKAWISSFCSLLHLSPKAITLDPKTAHLITVTFKTSDDANRFKLHLPRAASFIALSSKEVQLLPTSSLDKTVVLQRRIPLHFNEKTASSFFEFGTKRTEHGEISPLYKGVVTDRLLQLGVSLATPSENSELINTALLRPSHKESIDLLLSAAENLVEFAKAIPNDSSVAKRYFSSFVPLDRAGESTFSSRLISAFEGAKDRIKLKRIELAKKEPKENLTSLELQEQTLASAIEIVKKNSSSFRTDKTVWDFTTAAKNIEGNTLFMRGSSPFVEKISINWDADELLLSLYSDIETLAKQGSHYDPIRKYIYTEVMKASRLSGEAPLYTDSGFSIPLSTVHGSSSFLVMRLHDIAQEASLSFASLLQTEWNPTHPDLRRDSLPIWRQEQFDTLDPTQKKMGLLVYSPSLQNQAPPKGLKMGSLYVIAKGLYKILERFEEDPSSPAAKQFFEEFQELQMLLQKNHFFGYSGKSVGLSSEFSDDFIFEQENYFEPLLKASRENFSVKGTKRYALLDFSTVEQRILTENRIDTEIHDELLKWRDDYHSASVHLHGMQPLDIPAPTKSAFLSNLRLTALKYFRGDSQKVVKWGLDMSGGKTVQIELKNASGKPITEEHELKEGIRELRARVNKLGVSEVSLRQEGQSIVLDFPGSQNLTAQDLVKASSMYFHVVNEKFMTHDFLAPFTERFLQEVWNEAVLTSNQTPESIQSIAWNHLTGGAKEIAFAKPKSSAAKVLFEHGLRLSNPEESATSSDLNDAESKIVMFRGSSSSEWQGRPHPLLVVFNNYALEGANLEQVKASYDPSKGNFLSFSVKNETNKKNPREILELWTSRYSREKVGAGEEGTFSKGRGWRMAVLLNDSVITAPTLDSALKESASITGSFSLREINRLETDLKAGSLSFTPKILSEKNVSPELGAKERTSGITATALGALFIMGAMVIAYRFGGVVSSCAVVLNLFIMWAIFQNIGATLTLASIAGLVLTIAMAVDANVLVFERVREEYASSGKVALSLKNGYQKALSAILDSNITTLIAALILLSFDSGPVRGFAVTLIIGIISSFLTAVFMTRVFFSLWVQNPKHQELKLGKHLPSPKFNFLRWTKPTILTSIAVILLGFAILPQIKASLFGMDFTGGYAVNIKLNPSPNADYRQLVEQALIKKGVKLQEMQVRELDPKNLIRLFLSRSLEKEGRPFYNTSQDPNSKINWILSALKNEQISLDAQTPSLCSKSWSSVSSQMSDSMRNSAFLGLAVALVAILLYIAIRFEFKYALAATLCLLHDVIFSIATIALLHKLGLSVQIDLHTLAALMTIVGYSLNDTIIVFDRIREELKLKPKAPMNEVINYALNITLSRTLMTSGITLLVLIPLIFLGGSTLFGFSLVMAIGVVFGTLSSLFVAAPLMRFFDQREKKQLVTSSDA